jgi:hypothetical protein
MFESAVDAATAWAECSGAVLAKLLADRIAGLADVSDDLDGDAELYGLARGGRRLRGWAAAIEARAVALAYARALAEHRRFGLVCAAGRVAGAAGPSHRYDDVAYTRSEVAANLSLEHGITLAVADRQVGFALGLARHPELWLALAVGRIDHDQALAAVEELDHVLEVEVASRAVQALVTLPDAPNARRVLVRELRSGRKVVWDLPPGEIRRIIRREVAQLDPEVARLRTETARDRRHLRYHQLRDGMAELVLHGPAEQLSAAHRRVDEAARRAVPASVGAATLDQLRHDIAVSWLTGSDVGGGPRRLQALINVTVAGTTLLGLDDVPATLHGPAGPTEIPAELARQLAHRPDQATWRRILCDPQSGTAVDVSPGYRPPPRIGGFVAARDGYRSRFPVPGGGTVFEVDHVDRFDHTDPRRGRRTTAANLATAGPRDHHLKTDGALAVSGDANGVLVFRGRSDGRLLPSPSSIWTPRWMPRWTLSRGRRRRPGPVNRSRA